MKITSKKSTPPSNAPSQNQVITTSITEPSNIRQNINRHPRNNTKNIPEHKSIHQLALSISTSNHPAAATAFNYCISSKKQLQEKNRCNIHSQSSRLDCLIETISKRIGYLFVLVDRCKSNYHCMAILVLQWYSNSSDLPC